MNLFKMLKLSQNRSEIIVIALQKIAQGGVGFLITLLIVTFINREYHGYYFTLINFSAAYTLLDLGLSVLMVQISATLFAKSKINDIDTIKQGVDNVFLEMLVWVRQYFLKLSALFLLFLPIGYFYFDKSAPAILPNVWLWPLIITILSVALSIPAYAILSIIEGIGRVNEAYTLRILISLLGGILACFCILNNQPLFAPSMMPISMSLIAYYWAYRQYRNLLFYKESSFYKSDKVWHLNLIELRNKVKLTAIATFLFQSGPTLLIFYYLGSYPAGQMGLSISFLGIITFISSSFFIAKIPELTRLESIKNHLGSKKLFIYEFNRAIRLMLIGYSGWILIVYSIQGLNIAERFLNPFNMLLLTLNFIVIQLVALLNIHSRSQGQEIMAHPFFNATIISSVLFVIFSSLLSVTNILITMNTAYLVICMPPLIKYFKEIKKY